MRVLLLALVPAMLAGCLLADASDPPKCEKGFHPYLEKCVPDATTDLRVTIEPAAGGTSCSGDPATQRPPVLSPEVLQVKLVQEFQFVNRDIVAHEIRGTDGTSWANIGPAQATPFITLSKVGNWAYLVSGCAKGGRVEVTP